MYLSGIHRMLWKLADFMRIELSGKGVIHQHTDIAPHVQLELLA